MRLANNDESVPVPVPSSSANSTIIIKLPRLFKFAARWSLSKIHTESVVHGQDSETRVFAFQFWLSSILFCDPLRLFFHRFFFLVQKLSDEVMRKADLRSYREWIRIFSHRQCRLNVNSTSRLRNTRESKTRPTSYLRELKISCFTRNCIDQSIHHRAITAAKTLSLSLSSCKLNQALADQWWHHNG